MASPWQKWFRKRAVNYLRRPRLVLISGLVEQAESWYCNVDFWRRHFEVHTPALVAYEGEELHRRIDAGLPVDVNYFVEQLHLYLRSFVQVPPVHLLANSMGGKIAVEFAVRFPDWIASLVLLSPSGLSSEERLPIVGGVSRNNMQAMVDSVFYDSRHARQDVMEFFHLKYANRRWRTGILRTIRGTIAHSIRELLPQVRQPTLVVIGREDRIVDSNESIEAARSLPHGRVVILEHCGHAPQIEKAAAVNRLVAEFIQSHAQATPAVGTFQTSRGGPNNLLESGRDLSGLKRNQKSRRGARH